VTASAEKDSGGQEGMTTTIIMFYLNLNEK
jgi:hypothetical protein